MTTVSVSVTAGRRLAALIERLRPVSCGHDLIRVGPAHDGGYLIPDDLAGVSLCFSPGVSDNVGFETDLARRTGIPSVLADGTVEAPPPGATYKAFDKANLGSSTGPGVMRLEDWVARQAPDATAGDLLLQMDIEGAEYGVLIDTPASVLRRFRILVIEFHALDMLFASNCFALVSAIFDKLLADFRVCHVHPNNYGEPRRAGAIEVPPWMEFTFLRNDRLRPGGPPLVFPHPLDSPCIAGKPDVVLPRCWQPVAPTP